MFPAHDCLKQKQVHGEFGGIFVVGMQKSYYNSHLHILIVTVIFVCDVIYA